MRFHSSCMFALLKACFLNQNLTLDGFKIELKKNIEILPLTARAPPPTPELS